jgi:bifunctional N-acetylglucosamine-1-phosphate-uridyltransferase/glucosamine-1-phosphate-acetyltransferase GlmU-like protein
MVGKQVNVGAGIITWIYVGTNKRRAVIKVNDVAFIDPGTQPVAFVTIDKGATISTSFLPSSRTR